MASNLYLSNAIESLLTKLVEGFRETYALGDPFQPVRIVVPNLYLMKWLRMRLADELGVAVNIDFTFLENTLWKILRAHSSGALDNCAPLTRDFLHLMILAELEKNADKYRVFQKYIFSAPNASQESPKVAEKSAEEISLRRWQLSERLAGFFMEYTVQRADMVNAWLGKKYKCENEMEEAQRNLFREIFVPNGLRDKYAQVDGSLFLTLPEAYARAKNAIARIENQPKETYHLFGLSQVSEFHGRLLRTLEKCVNFKIYHLSFCSDFYNEKDSRTAWSRHIRNTSVRNANDDERLPENPAEDALLRLWGGPGREFLWLLGAPERAGEKTDFTCDCLPSTKPVAPQKGILHLLQDNISGVKINPAPQDTSLQIVGCPGIQREVETVYNSIIYNLARDPDLKMTDIAVLVSDMSTYKPVIESVFEREPQRITYNLSDSTAAEDSLYGQAVASLLNLMTSGFTRAEMFQLFGNPCFLAKKQLNQDDISTWLQWVDNLHIYRGFSQEHKYRDVKNTEDRNDHYTWELGLRRLRLGRIMQSPKYYPEDERLLHYREIVPYSDMQSHDPHLVVELSKAVQGLYAYAKKFAGALNCQEWKEELSSLLEEFLEVPEGAHSSSENYVRGELLKSLGAFDALAKIRTTMQLSDKVDFQTARKILESGEAEISSHKGKVLTGGVCISAIRPMRPAPFKVIYILGLGEGQFPGRTNSSALDLRSYQRRIGDIVAPEANRYLFLETLMSARQKLYLTYNNRELQKDQILYPGSIINQVIRYIEENILPDISTSGQLYETSKYQISEMPLKASSIRYFQADIQPEVNSKSDVMLNYSNYERILALQDLKNLSATKQVAMKKEFDEQDFASLQEQINKLAILHAHTATTSENNPLESVKKTVRVNVRDLKEYLVNPVEATVKRHLSIRDEYEDDRNQLQTEPLFTGYPTDVEISKSLCNHVITKCPEKLMEYSKVLDKIYEDRTRRCETPDGIYGVSDKKKYQIELQPLFTDNGILSQLLAKLQTCRKETNVCIGSSVSTAKSTVVMPPFKTNVNIDGVNVEVLLEGQIPYLFYDPKTNESSALFLANSSKANGKQKVPKQLLDPFLSCFLAFCGAKQTPPDKKYSVLFGDSITIYIVYKDKCLFWKYKLDNSQTVEQYFCSLLKSYLRGDDFDYLPFDAVASMESDPRQINDAPAYAQDLQEELDSLLQGQHYYPMKVVLDTFMEEPEIPSDALSKVQERFGLLYQFEETGEIVLAKKRKVSK